jgi:hypothetical protein
MQQDGINDYDTVMLLDCDTIIVQDPGEYLDKDIFRAKIADGPTMPHENFEVLFDFFGMALPPQSYTCTAWGQPTIPYFNTGVLVFPNSALNTLVPMWVEFTNKLLQNMTLISGREHFCEQASMSLALAATKQNYSVFGNEMNFPTHFEERDDSPLLQNVDPVIIHYHSCFNSEGYINASKYLIANERINVFNNRLQKEYQLMQQK